MQGRLWGASTPTDRGPAYFLSSTIIDRLSPLFFWDREVSASPPVEM